MAEVRYMTDDVDKGVEFYTQHLGFTLKQQFGTAFASVCRGDQTLWLSGPRSSAALPMPDGRQPSPGGWNRLVIEVEDIQATVAVLKQSGVRFRNEVISGPGGQQVLVEDPSGNPVELFQPG